jgi:hypothetical protein
LTDRQSQRNFDFDYDLSLVGCERQWPASEDVNTEAEDVRRLKPLPDNDW